MLTLKEKSMLFQICVNKMQKKMQLTVDRYLINKKKHKHITE